MEEGREAGQGRGLAARLGTLARRPWVAALPAGLATIALTVAAFPPVDLAEAAYVWALPSLLWLWLARPSPLATGIYGLATGWLSWVLLIDWLRFFTHHLEMPLREAVGLALTAGLALWPALYATLWLLAARWVVVRLARWSAGARLFLVLGLAALWVCLEWLRGWALSGFPWLPLAASQWDRPVLLQLLPWTGQWGLSFLLIFANLALCVYARHLARLRLARTWAQRLCPELYLFLGLLGACFVGGLLALQDRPPEREAFEVGLVQPYLLPAQRYGPGGLAGATRTMEDLTRWAAALDPDLLLWPEAPLPLVGNRGHGAGWLQRLVDALETPLLGGWLAQGMAEAPGGQAPFYNAVGLIAPGDPSVPLPHEHPFYAKRHLVPFGEYMPLPRWIPLLSQLVPVGEGFSAGEDPVLLPFDGPDGRLWTFGPLICYEDVYPQLARTSVLAGADILFVATSTAWYGQAGMPWQHKAHSVLRAVENRRTVLRCGNGGWSGCIDPYGAVRAEITDPEAGVYVTRTQTVPVSIADTDLGRVTFYTRHGDVFVLLCLLFALAAGGWAVRAVGRDRTH